MIWLWRKWLGVEDKILKSLTPLDERWLSELRRQGDVEYPVSIGRR